MRDQILALQQKGSILNPDAAQRHNDRQAVIEFAEQFIERLTSNKAFVRPKSLKGKLEHPENPLGQWALILDELEHHMITNGLNPASGGHLGYIPGGGIHSCALGDYLAAVTNQYAGIGFGGPGAVKIENELIRWMCRLMGYPEGSLGNLASGGSTANLIAFVTAREARGIRSDQYSQQCIYLTRQVHHCIHKAIRICGLTDAHTRFVDTDERFRMKPEVLVHQIEQDLRDGLQPFMIIGSIGTTDTGAVDPVRSLGEIAARYKLWYHIDAAYGGFFILSSLMDREGVPVRELFQGVEMSDSLAIDPHKGMFLAYGLGAILIKDVASQYKAHYYRAAYMQDSLASQEELSPADLSAELTKHFRGLRLWLPMRMYGVEPFAALLDEKILLCRYFYERIGAAGFTTGPYPELSVCIYRYVPERGDANAFNEKVYEKVIDNGRIFISTTNIDGVYWMRLAVLSFRTHLEEIDILLENLTDALRQTRTELSVAGG